MSRSGLPPQAYANGQILFPSVVFIPLRDLIVYLSVESPIFPGDPIRFSWSAMTLSVSPLDLGTVSFSLYLVDENDNIDPNTLLVKQTLSKADSAQVTPADYQSPTYSPQLTDEVAIRLYKLGSYALRLVVSGTGADGPFESYDAWLVVRPQTVDDSWWQWTVPIEQDVGWKDQYRIQGNFINRAKHALVTCTATVLETNMTDGDGSTIEVASDHATAGIGQSAAVPFAQTNFAKSWSWFIWGIMTPNGAPMERLFLYEIRLDVVDECNNGYPAGTTSGCFVDVRVSGQKIAALSTATGLMAGAIVILATAAATVCTPAGPILGAIGAGMAAAANALGAAANDPPVPDPLFRSPVELTPISYPEEPHLAGVLAVLRAVSDITVRVEALGVIASRIVGAQSVRDVEAEQAQEKQASNLRDELQALGKRVARLTPLAAAFLTGHKTMTPDAIRRGLALWRRDMRVRAQLQQYFVDAGGSFESFQSLQSLIENSTLMEAVVRPSTIMAGIGRWSERLALAVAEEEPNDTGHPVSGRAQRKMRS